MKIGYEVLRFEHVPPVPGHRGEGILIRLRATAMDGSGNAVVAKGYPVSQEVEEVAALSTYPFSGDRKEYVKRFVDSRGLKAKLDSMIAHHLHMVGLHEPSVDIPKLNGPVKVDL